MDLYAAICVVANVLNRLDVSASGRKETRASPICFWWRRFGEPLRNRFRVAALADCWCLRSAVVDEAGCSLHPTTSRPYVKKANENKKDQRSNDKSCSYGTGRTATVFCLRISLYLPYKLLLPTRNVPFDNTIDA